LDFLYNNFISDFFSMILQWIHDAITGDYVLAILLVTLLLRLMLLPLDIKQKRQMRKMTAMQERVNKIKERYANNKEKQQKKISEFYKQEGVSPFSSCLPLLFQFVFLLAFFGAVRSLSNHETVAMVAQAAKEGAQVHLPSFLWIKNIWQPDALSLIEKTTNVLPSAADFQNIVNSSQVLKDMLPQGFNADMYNAVTRTTLEPYIVGGAKDFFGQIGVVLKQSNGYFLLPLLAGASAFYMGIYQFKSGMVQQQGKIMKYGLPLFSVYICAVTGSAFAIYWTFTNVFSILQQMVLNKYFQRENDDGDDDGKKRKINLAFWKKKQEDAVEKPVDKKEDA